MMLKKISIIIACLGGAINIFLFGLNRGYDISGSETLGFYIPHESGYALLSRNYFYLVLLFLFYAIGKFVNKNYSSKIICFSALIITVFPLRNIYLQTILFYNKQLPINQILQESIMLDWISFSLIISLLLIQIITPFQHYFDWKSKNAEID